MLLIGLAAALAGSLPKLTDAQVLAMSADPLPRHKMGEHVVGWHDGMKLNIVYGCGGDVCGREPDARWIYYDNPPGKDCEARGGRTQTLVFPNATSMLLKQFCVPKILPVSSEQQARLPVPSRPRPPHGPRPVTPSSSWITEEDYPAGEKRAGIQGTTSYVLTISATGAVTSCRVEASSGSRHLDAETCRLVEARARFEPAVDRRDHPVSSHYIGASRWVIRQTR